ncbi:tripartite tricarboxylate transporter TctB family protein [Rhodoplanes roseus]|uniref:DUF1468 domain-containing protein n=1 Tax=Rhodoplanes roseus TaxID=29409 RepID=A0A327KZ35_9BRAD|nr:tripartite tricarboxylate transporter TctB family protein [Rhodoplanes roseus]RAI44140.1 hypothetical protein CH341_10650 [Rhodoplanes roseus]
MIASKDVWAGLMFIAFAALFAVAGAKLRLGSAGVMGPGYFPMVLAGALALLGLGILGRAVAVHIVAGGARKLPLLESARVRIDPRPLLVLLVALVVFALLVGRAGLVLTTLLVAVIGSFAGTGVRWPQMLMLAAFLSALTYVIFVAALAMPLPVWPRGW